MARSDSRASQLVTPVGRLTAGYTASCQIGIGRDAARRDLRIVGVGDTKYRKLPSVVLRSGGVVATKSR